MRLSLIVPNLLTWDGKRKVTGGLEKYVWALLRLLREMGVEADVHQNGDTDWVKEVDGVTIYGYGLSRISVVAAIQAMHQNTEQVLYSSMCFEPLTYRHNSILISHGVWWDSPTKTPEYVQQMLNLCRDAITQTEKTISCDYNFLNVMRATAPGLADKVQVIPNFVDVNLFYPPKNRESNELVILYPRRLDNSRGIDLFLYAGKDILETYPQVRLHLAVDKNHEDLNQGVQEYIATNLPRDRVTMANYRFEDMPDVYRRAHITLIPSRFSEGTSFSCLEALASGSAVLSTDVGGLTNIIIDGYNGLLVPPQLDRISKALKLLIENEQMRRRLAENGVQTAQAFSFESWKKKWRTAISEVYLR